MEQTPGTERILYGVDDVKNAAEIIIVEGEMDKLALEEAGMRNVISVPDGAPRAVKEGELPPPEADTKFQYLWNCRAVLDQAVRIVLATDSDAPGQVVPPSLTCGRGALSRLLVSLRCMECRWLLVIYLAADAWHNACPYLHSHLSSTQALYPCGAVLQNCALNAHL